MDLGNLIPKEDTITFEIKHPFSGEVLTKDNGKPMTITVYFPHAPQYKAAVHAQNNKRIVRANKGKGTTFTSEEIEQATLDLLVQTTKDWDIQLDGKNPKFSESACRDVYDKLPWIRKQVLEAQEEFESFLKS